LLILKVTWYLGDMDCTVFLSPGENHRQLFARCRSRPGEFVGVERDVKVSTD